jgi:hypothetical protein
MRMIGLCWMVTAMLGCAHAANAPGGRTQHSYTVPEQVQPQAAAPSTEPLALSELLAPSLALEPSDKARALLGKRVRVTGFMADMELPPRGGFFLVAHPLHCDEGGAGTADLPPESLFVISDRPAAESIPQIAGPIDVVGTLELGASDPHAHVPAGFRLRLSQAASSTAPQLVPVSHRVTSTQE